jgi:CHAD domain-containing protein
MTGTRAAEQEAKFDVDEAYDPPDLRPVVGRTRRLTEQRLRTRYYDTVDRRLWGQGVSLRHRTGEGNAEGAGTWTLKLPGREAGDILSRHELTWPGGAGEMPAEAAAIVRGLARRLTLGEVVVLETRRRRLALHGPGTGRPWGELDDDLVTVVGGPHDGLRFRQVELELAPDHPPEATSVLDSLRSSGARPGAGAKLAMALGDEPDARRDGTSKTRRRETLANTVRASMEANLNRLLEHDYRLRADLQRPRAHDVHQARVATRRLRSDLKTFGSVLDPVWLRHTTEECWIGTVLGRVRDADVLVGHLHRDDDARAMSGNGLVRLQERLDGERSRAAVEVSAALASNRYLDLLDKLHPGIEATPFLRGAAARSNGAAWEPEGPATAALPALVAARWRKLKRTVEKGGAHPSDEELHQMRIAAKRLRYAAEAAAPVIGQPAQRTARAAERVQTLLGEFHDAVAAERWLGAGLDGNATTAHAAFAAGRLSAEERRRQRQIRRDWRPEWKRLRRRKNHSWL